MQQNVQQDEEPIGFRGAVNIFRHDPAVWEKVRDYEGEVQALTFDNGVDFIVRRANGVRSYAVRNPDSARRQEAREAIERGQIERIYQRQARAQMS